MFETVAQEKDREKTMPIITEVFNGKSFEGLEWEDRSCDGTLRYVYTSTYPLFDLHGKILMGISANVDITVQKTIEQELMSSKDHLEKIMETPRNLIVELDKDLKVQMFNKGAEEVTGYARAEAIGRDWVELFIPDRLKSTVRNIFEEFKNDSKLFPSQYENPILTKSGEEK